MTYGGKNQSPDSWIENAKIQWKEDEAPFHSVGRLTLLPKFSSRPRPGKRHTSMLRDTLALTLPPLEASIEPGIRAKSRAEKHGCLRMKQSNLVVDKISHILRASKSIVPLSTERASNATHILEQQEHIPLVKSRHPTIRARNLPRQCSMRSPPAGTFSSRYRAIKLCT